MCFVRNVRIRGREKERFSVVRVILLLIFDVGFVLNRLSDNDTKNKINQKSK